MSEETAIVSCETSAGPIKIKLFHEWSPFGYDRAVELFEKGYYDNSHFFRTVPNFLVQFGITYSESQELKRFARTTIPDDSQLDPRIEFKEGMVSYAGSGENSRTSQLFIAYAPNKNLGTNPWETPIGKVIEGMDNVRNFYSGYGDMPPWGKGPVQGKIYAGPSYIEDNFPKTSRFETCTVERGSMTNVEENEVKDDDGTNDDETKEEGKDDDETEEKGKVDIEEKSHDLADRKVKKHAAESISGRDTNTNLKRAIKSRVNSLRSKTEETETSTDLIAVSGILVIILLAIAIKSSRGKKKSGKTS